MASDERLGGFAPDVVPEHEAVRMETHECVTATQRHDHLRRPRRIVAGITHSTGTGIGREYQGPHAGKTTTPEFPANDPAQSGKVLLLPHQTVTSPKLLGAADSLLTACAQFDALLAEPFPCARSNSSDEDERKFHARERNTGGCSARRVAQPMQCGRSIGIADTDTVFTPRVK